MKYLLTKSQNELLFKISKNIVIQAKLIESSKGPYVGNRYIIDLNEEELEKILDELTNVFISQGVDQAYEPNAYGLQIERLIDIFSSEEKD